MDRPLLRPFPFFTNPFQLMLENAVIYKDLESFRLSVADDETSTKIPRHKTGTKRHKG
jgi:hypothetical protein